MTRSSATKGKDAQFTYDFGIAIAQGTVNKLTRLTGATLTLASAFYALKTTATQYVDVLKENTLRFGGILSTMKAMQQAQDRLIKGQSYFTMEDQLRGMNQLMAVGVDVGKNLDWINKSAHAVGKSYSEFSGIIASAIQGNTQALVDAGLMTQRATRMFDKYAANTIMRQQAILNFVKNHKGLMNAIKNDFETIQDQMVRIRAIWQSFLQSVVGKPNDPQSFYGQIVYSMKMVATSLANNMDKIKKYGYIIGQTLGWVIRQIGHFVVWVGRQMRKSLESVWSVTENFQEQSRSLLVWLEFWKLRLLDFFNEYGGLIKGVLKLLIAYKALKSVFVISNLAIASLVRYKKMLAGVLALQSRYILMMGATGSKFTRWLQSLAVFMPKWTRKLWVSVGKYLALIFSPDFSVFKSFGLFINRIFGTLGRSLKFVFGLIRNFPAILAATFKAIRALWVALNLTNPVGWVLLAITLFTTLYIKSKSFRTFINNLFKSIWESLKLIWNSLAYIITYAIIGIKKMWSWFKTYIWKPVSDFFKNTMVWIDDMWKKFMNTSVGKWIDKWIVQPLKSVFEWIVDAWGWVTKGVKSMTQWLSGANDTVSQATKDAAKKYGVPNIPVFSGGNPDTNDSTNYLNPKNWGITGNKTEDTPAGNPLIQPEKPVKEQVASTNSSNLTFGNGAIQIIVQKGEGIDENKLARKIKQVLLDIKRDNDIRGGTL